MAPKIRGGFSPIGVRESDVVSRAALNFGISAFGQEPSLASGSYPAAPLDLLPWQTSTSTPHIACSPKHSQC